MPPTRQKQVAIVIDPRLPFGQRVMEGVYRYSQEHEAWRFHTVDSMPYLPFEAIGHWKGDGLILGGEVDLVRHCRRRRIPFVNVTTQQPPFHNSVMVDNRAIGAMAADHLLAKGLRSFAVVCWKYLIRWNTRIEGFRESVTRAGYPCREIRVDFRDPAVPMSRSDMTGVGDLLRSLPQPIGLFAMNDALAREVIDACLEGGLRVPEDVAVIGEGNGSFVCELMIPRLSCVDADTSRVGYHAAELLDKLMSGGKAPSEPILIPPLRVVERDSTDIHAIGAPLVAQAIQFIRDHIAQPIQVAQILEEVLVNRRTLERHFRRALGRTVFEETRRLKINHARQLLIDTDMTIGNIGSACGYANRERFNAAFRIETGMTPSRFRLRGNS